MALGLTDFERSGLEEEMKRISKCAKGSIPGIVSARLEKSDLDKLKENRDKAIKDADDPEKVPSVYKTSKAIYNTAAYRDAKYSLSGRKFMRCCGLNGKQYSAFGRILHYEWHQNFKKRDK